MIFDDHPTTFSHAHIRPACAVVLINLGSPTSPTPQAVADYLRVFLADQRVVEVWRPLWLTLLYGVIVPLRSFQSAKKYQRIWHPTQGSPLIYWGGQLANALKTILPEYIQIHLAMRYGDPKLEHKLDDLHQQGVQRVLIVPLFPQYSAATNASIMDGVMHWCARKRNLPELRFVRSFASDTGYINALAAHIQNHRHQIAGARKLIMSFHGLPERNLYLGDPYFCECHLSARILAQALGLEEKEYMVTFQSRFGKAKWLSPYTEQTVVALAHQGVTELDIVCPGFLADCLETLDEIAFELKEKFYAAGGKQLNYISCLNAETVWVKALAEMIRKHLWQDLVAEDDMSVQTRLQRARSRGAPF